MRALVADRYGSPDVLRFRDMPVPEPSAGEIRVRVRASTVNRTDTAYVRGHPFFARAATGWLRPRFPVTGMDFAGEVDACGPGVTDFALGDRVFGMSPERFGAHAAYLCVPAAGPVARVPGSLDLHEAVVCEGAWYANGTTRHLSPGKSALIFGASGAIGTAAVQLARIAGAEVTAVVRTRHVALAASLGADRVVDGEAEDFTQLDATFDLVFDAVGKTSYAACRRLLKPDGVFSATDLGPAWSNIALSAWSSLTGSGRVRIPFPEDAEGFVRQLAALIDEGRYHGVFDRTFAFEDIVDAFRYVESGRKTGIVVIDMMA